MKEFGRLRAIIQNLFPNLEKTFVFFFWSSHLEIMSFKNSFEAELDI